jgi:hypothetical protein
MGDAIDQLLHIENRDEFDAQLFDQILQPLGRIIGDRLGERRGSAGIKVCFKSVGDFLDRFQDLVIARAKDRHDDLSKSDESFFIDHDDAAPGSEHAFHFVRANYCTLAVGKQPERQLIMIGESAVFFDRVHIDPDDLGAGLRISFPVVADAAKLFGADRRFIAGIEEQDDDFAARIAQLPPFAVAVREFEIGGELANLRSYCACHGSRSPLGCMGGDSGASFCYSEAKFTSRRDRRHATILTLDGKPDHHDV